MSLHVLHELTVTERDGSLGMLIRVSDRPARLTNGYQNGRRNRGSSRVSSSAIDRNAFTTGSWKNRISAHRLMAAA